MSVRSYQGYDNKWKEKYLQLLDEHKIKGKQTRANEELLCKTVIRLTLAAKGINKELDPYLERIHQSVKSNLTDTQLQTDLDELAKAAQQFGRKNTAAKEDGSSLLFDYLIKQYTDATTVQTIRSLQKQYQNNVFGSTDDLITSLLDATSAPHSTAPLSQSDAANQSKELIEAKIVSDQLLLLLDNLIIPFEFEEKVEQLKIRLQNHHSSASLEPLLNDYVGLLVHIKKHILSEQQDIENFLSQITEQLTELGLQAYGATAAAHQSSLNRKKLDQYVSAQMKELQQSSDRADEEKQRLQTQRQLNELSAKIKQMESESSDLKSKLAMAHDRALRDPLTGLANRAAYDDRLEIELSRQKRYQSPLSLVICDIDNFKNINDTFGHKAGDKTLKIISQLLTKNCRRLDFLSRFGGEEFTLLLPNTDKESALKFANKLRLIIEKTRFNYSNKSIAITISCGISEFREGDSPESVFERADQALYYAKNSGRNRCLLG